MEYKTFKRPNPNLRNKHMTSHEPDLSLTIFDIPDFYPIKPSLA